MEIAPPLSIEQVETLILSLYAANSPEAITRTQATLSEIQTSPGAWLLAHQLLSRPDEKVRFFGALTLIVKLNTESSSLSESDATELLVNLIGWYIESLHRDSSRLVARKLVSALSTFFFRFHQLWPRCLTHLAVCLASQQTRSALDVKEHIPLVDILISLEISKVQATIWLASQIVEDAARLDMNSSANAGTYKAILDNLPDTILLLKRCMDINTSTASAREDSMKCIQAWVMFSQRFSSRDHQVADVLRPLFTNVIGLLTNQENYETAVELTTEVLCNHASLLNVEQNEMIATLLQSGWAKGLYGRLMEGDFDFDVLQFGLLYLEFAQTKVEDLIQTSQTQGHAHLSSLSGILAAEGYPVAENKIFVPAVEFWSTFAETLPEYLPTEDEQPNDFAATAVGVLLTAAAHAWHKIQYPPASEFMQWDSNDRAGFVDARKDVVDLLQSTYVLVGPRLVATFVEATLSALSSSSWLEMEAAAYCLGGLADCCKEDERCDKTLSLLFQSPLFSVLQNNVATIPARVRQTCLSLIELYTEYFERNKSLLAPALQLLFSMLADSSMAPTASKSIFRLCSTCRGHLHTEMDAFITEYQRHTFNRELDCSSTEKIMGALACIAQAIADPQRRYSSCAKILSLVEQNVDNSKGLISANDPHSASSQGIPCPDCAEDEHPGLHAGLKALRCLASVGKGFQSPPDAAIDLEASTLDESPNMQLGEVQTQVVNIIVTIQQTFSTSVEVTEQICSVLRAGFSESQAGPFVLPPKEVAHYLTSHSYETPRIGLLVSAACSFLSSIKESNQSQDLLSHVLIWIIGLLKTMPGPDSDSELVQNGIEFTTRLLNKSPRVLLELQPNEAAEYLFLLTLQVLDGKEPLPKGASAEFWASFVNLRPSDQGLQPLLSTAVSTLGPFLCRSLARNIGGNASRSELDRLSEPLKKLVSRHPKSKDWLVVALNDESFPSDKVTQEQKAMFVKKLVSLRGSRASNQVVRDFWLACRGSNFAYAS